MQSRNVTILAAIGIPAGLGLAIFSFGIFFGSAWAANGGDMPAGSPVTPGMQFSKWVMYAAAAGVLTGAAVSIASLITLIIRLTRKSAE